MSISNNGIYNNNNIPIEVEYAKKIKASTMKKDLKTAIKLYKQMCAEGLSCNLVTFNTLIDACSRVGDMNQANLFLKEMSTKNIIPDLITWSTLIKGWCIHGNLNEALSLFSQMRSKGLEPDAVLFNSILDGCAKKQMRVLTELVLQDMEKAGVSPSNFSLSILVKLYGRCRDLPSAFRVFYELPTRHNFKANAHAYTSLIASCISNSSVDEGIAVYINMIYDNHIAIDSKATRTIIIGCIRHDRLDVVLYLLYEYILSPFHTTLDAKCVTNAPKGNSYSSEAKSVVNPVLVRSLDTQTLEEVVQTLLTNEHCLRNGHNTILLSYLRYANYEIPSNIYYRLSYVPDTSCSYRNQHYDYVGTSDVIAHNFYALKMNYSYYFQHGTSLNRDNFFRSTNYSLFFRPTDLLEHGIDAVMHESHYSQLSKGNNRNTTVANYIFNHIDNNVVSHNKLSNSAVSNRADGQITNNNACSKEEMLLINKMLDSKGLTPGAAEDPTLGKSKAQLNSLSNTETDISIASKVCSFATVLSSQCLEKTSMESSIKKEIDEKSICPFFLKSALSNKSLPSDATTDTESINREISTSLGNSSDNFSTSSTANPTTEPNVAPTAVGQYDFTTHRDNSKRRLPLGSLLLDQKLPNYLFAANSYGAAPNMYKKCPNGNPAIPNSQMESISLGNFHDSIMIGDSSLQIPNCHNTFSLPEKSKNKPMNFSGPCYDDIYTNIFNNNNGGQIQPLYIPYREQQGLCNAMEQYNPLTATSGSHNTGGNAKVSTNSNNSGIHTYNRCEENVTYSYPTRDKCIFNNLPLSIDATNTELDQVRSIWTNEPQYGYMNNYHHYYQDNCTSSNNKFTPLPNNGTGNLNGTSTTYNGNEWGYHPTFNDTIPGHPCNQPYQWDKVLCL